MRRIMRAFKIAEISGVDRPAQAHARAAIMKRDITDVTKKTGGVFAIGKDNALLKKLGLLKGFGVNAANHSTALATSIKSIVEDQDAADKGALVDETIKQFSEAVADDLVKTLSEGNSDEPSDEDKMSAALAKALGLADTASVEDIVAAVAAKDAALAKATADADAVNKAAHEAALAKAAEEKAELAKRVAVLEGERELAKHEARAEEIGLPKAYGAFLMKARAGDADSAVKLEDTIKGLTEQVRTGKLFAELGDAKGGSTVEPYAEITAKAEELRKASPKAYATIEKAKAAVMADPANAELMVRYREERAAKVK